MYLCMCDQKGARRNWKPSTGNWQCHQLNFTSFATLLNEHASINYMSWHPHVTNDVFHCTPRCSSFQINSTLPIFSPFWTAKNLLRCFRSKFAPQLAHHLFLRPLLPETHQMYPKGSCCNSDKIKSSWPLLDLQLERWCGTKSLCFET